MAHATPYRAAIEARIPGYVTWNDKLRPYLPNLPVGDLWKGRLVNFMFVVATVQIVPVLIFAWGVWKTKKSAGIRLEAVYLSLAISLSWIAYGLLLGEAVIIVASALLIVANITLIVLVSSARKNGYDEDTGKEKSGTTP